MTTLKSGLRRAAATLGPHHLHRPNARIAGGSSKRSSSAVAVATGVALRAAATSDLWVDEALTVNIAKLPVHGIFDALRHDGHPPLYYLLLHGWMSVFGQSDRRGAGPVRPVLGGDAAAHLADGLARRRPPLRGGGSRLAGHVAAGSALRHRDPDVLPRGARSLRSDGSPFRRRFAAPTFWRLLGVGGLCWRPVAHPLLERVSPHGDVPDAVLARHARPPGGPAQPLG